MANELERALNNYKKNMDANIKEMPLAMTASLNIVRKKDYQSIR